MILAVKAHQVETAVLSIRDKLSTDSHIFLLQNGMGTLETVTDLLADVLSPGQIYPGVNTNGAYLSKNNLGLLEVIHAGEGNLVFGNNYLCKEQSGQPEIFADLKDSGLGELWSDNIESQLWIKLAVNAVINPLTAVNDCLNGHLLESESLKQQVEQLTSELADLYSRLELAISIDEIIAQVHRVINKTAGNQSSMLQDVHAAKSTEIEAITGYLLKKADILSLPMAAHRRLYQQIISKSLN
jgi:2-dehydropantoate 2-reductase